MNTDDRALLSHVMIGLGTIADASDRLLDMEVAACACQLADRMQATIAAILAHTQTSDDVASLQEAIAEMQTVVREHATPREPDPRHEELRQLARDRRLWTHLDIAPDADVVEDDDGAYVTARVWVRLGRRP